MFNFYVSRYANYARSFLGPFVVLLSTTGLAYAEVQPGLPADDSMANITMAQPDALGAIRSAPGILALLPKYQVAGGGGWSSEPRRHISVSAVDSSNGPFALGLDFTRHQGSPVAQSGDLPGWHLPNQDFDNVETEIVAGGAAGLSFANRTSSLALGGHYIARRTTYTQDLDAFELTASGGLHLQEQIIMSATARDLLQSQGPVHLGSAFRWGPTDTSFRGSAFRSYGGVEVDVDTFVDLDGVSLNYVGVSGDLLITDSFILRSGYRFDDYSHNIGAGFAIDNTSVGLEYGGQVGLKEGLILSHSHSIGVRIRL